MEDVETTTNDAEPEVVEAPTAEEQIATLKTQLEAEQAEKTKLSSRMQGLEGSLKEKDKQLKDKTDIRSEFDTLKNMVKVMATQGIGVDEDSLNVSDPSKKANIDKLFSDMEDKQIKQTEENNQREAQREYAVQAQATFKDASEVFKDDIVAVAEIETLLDRGDIKLAQAKVAKAKGKPKEVKVVETEAEMETRIRKKIETEQNLRSSVTGKPAGGNPTLESLRAKDINTMSPGELKEHGKLLKQEALKLQATKH